MFFKKKKKITTAKAEIIDLGEIKPCNDNLTEVRIDVPENCQEFFQENAKKIITNIMPVIGGMVDNEQSYFSCYITYKGRKFYFSVGEDLGVNTPTNCIN